MYPLLVDDSWGCRNPVECGVGCRSLSPCPFAPSSPCPLNPIPNKTACSEATVHYISKLDEHSILTMTLISLCIHSRSWVSPLYFANTRGLQGEFFVLVYYFIWQYILIIVLIFLRWNEEALGVIQAPSVMVSLTHPDTLVQPRSRVSSLLILPEEE